MKRAKSINANDIMDDIENPESAFDLIMNADSQTPIRQCRSLLQCLKQPPVKQKAILSEVRMQKLTKKEIRLKRQNKPYSQYKEVLNRTLRVENKQKFINNKFQHYVVNSSKMHNRSLTSTMNNLKIRLINQDNMLESQKIKVQGILANNKNRQQIFQQALLFQRLYHIQQQKKIDKGKVIIPQRIKGYDPKHLRIPQKYKTQQDYYRRKYVHNQRKFHFFKYAIKIEKSTLQTKKRQNNNVIKAIMSAAKQQIDSRKLQVENQDNFLTYRIFLKYSSYEAEKPQDMFTLIKNKDIIKMFQDLDIQLQINELKNILIQNQHFSYFQFIQILDLALSNNNQQSFDRQKYLSKLKYVKPQKIYPNLWFIKNKENNTIKKITKIIKFKDTIYNLFNKRLSIKNVGQEKLDLNDILQLLWELQIYPKIVDKKTVRFYFAYIKLQSIGLNANQLFDLFIILIIKKAQSVTLIQQTIRKTNEQLLKFITKKSYD